MAPSALSITAPITVFSINKPASISRPTSSSSSSCRVCCLSHDDKGGKNVTLGSVSTAKKWVLDAGIGLLAAASVVASSPLDANATRIEYYATVGEPLCDFNFVRSGLGFCDISVGSGVEAPYAELINIHYTARFADGTVFDSSYKRGRPLTMRIGVGKGKIDRDRENMKSMVNVISGLDQGIFGGEGVPPMHVGGKRKLQIPPHLAYGPEPAGCFSGDCNIPGNATLVYDIKFVGIYSGNRKEK